MDTRVRLQLTAAVLVGVLLTLGYKDLYPDLERRFRRQRARRRPRSSAAVAAGLVSDSGIHLEDHEKANGNLQHNSNKDVGDIPSGIEACVGNTPLFRIKSLSEATGCDILAKAEVVVWPSCFVHVL